MKRLCSRLGCSTGQSRHTHTFSTLNAPRFPPITSQTTKEHQKPGDQNVQNHWSKQRISAYVKQCSTSITKCLEVLPAMQNCLSPELVQSPSKLKKKTYYLVEIFPFPRPSPRKGALSIQSHTEQHCLAANKCDMWIAKQNLLIFP